MEKAFDIETLARVGSDDLSLTLTIFNFCGAIVVSFLVKSFYTRYSFSLTGKMHIGSVIPILTAVIFLVIVIVKSSLALSLGLVGALSIVRFRTPIKEPEELVYLFLAIAIGLGFGAGYPIITALITVLTLVIIFFLLSNKRASAIEYNLLVNWSNQEISFDTVAEIIGALCMSLKLIRFESDNQNNSSVFLIELSEQTDLDTLVTKLKRCDENINVTFFEAKTNW